jgi:hypothetical protein
VATCDPRYEWQDNSENDKDHDGARGLKAFIAQKNGERAAVNEQAGDKDKIPERRLGADCNIMHMCLGCT